jgi:hypothetical protein
MSDFSQHELFRQIFESYNVGRTGGGTERKTEIPQIIDFFFNFDNPLKKALRNSYSRESEQ